MAKVLTIKKGLSLKLKGAAPQEYLSPVFACSSYALVPDDFQGVVPKLLVREGDKVAAGDAVFFHKRMPSVMFVAPVSGEVTAINRGAKRKILSIEIKPDAEQTYRTTDVSRVPSMIREEIRELLCKSGLWGFMRQRPFDIVPDPAIVPRDIFITANFTAPLAPDFDFLAKGHESEIQLALDVLGKLTDGKVYLGTKPGSLTGIQGVEHYEVKGAHPAGLVGVLINKVKPINKDETVWTLKASDLIVLGRFLKTGKPDFSRTIAITGSDAKEHGYVTVIPGTNIKEAFRGRLTKKETHERVIDGNVFTGVKLTEERPFISFACDQITVIPEGDDVDEIFGWIAPRTDQYSVSRSYCSWLHPNKEYALDARIKGGERAMIQSNEYDKVFPFDIYPEYLLKAIIAFNITDMENRGIYEVAPEDFSVCEFVDSSKMPLQEIVRKGLDLLYNEIN
ncbi:Na(+)-translocating NADH-quinone reductase subunit A [Porphyromonas macacae]|uniref:Na(+)-translocating NADH-quinone reductase subunit A n=1 Tax=Porphyromonas macacae TaxID=28115 RepID=UPI0024AD4A61|nr:Na(+)-translocating NADH-quinone reductase subunit A [Porphyromonas macacae]